VLSSRYYRDNDDFVFVAQSNNVTFANVNEPTQGHLALTGLPDQMRVMWVTNSSAYASSVRFGLSSTTLDQEATGSSHTYTAASMCGPYANQSTFVVAPQLYTNQTGLPTSLSAPA
jgi:hypothetical protein